MTNTSTAKVYTVSGAISTNTDRPLRQLMVVAFDKDLRSRQILGQSLSDREGKYIIRYTADKFSRAEKGSADLFIGIFQPADAELKELIASSEIIFNARQEETINLILTPAQFSYAPEFILITRDVDPLLDGIGETELEEDESHQDISFLAAETGWSMQKLEWFSLSFKLESDSGIHPQLWYALLSSGLFEMPVAVNPNARKQVKFSLALRAADILDRASNLSVDQAKAALDDAIRKNLVQDPGKDQAARIIEKLKEFTVQKRLNDKKDPLFTSMLEQIGFNEEKIKTVSYLTAEHGLLSPEFMANAEKSNLFDKEDMTRLANVFRLDAVLAGNKELLSAVVREGIDDPTRLAKISTGEWEEFISKGVVEIPKEIPGDKKKELIHNYAVFINKRFEDTFPTAAFSGGLKRAIAGGNTNLKSAQAIDSFLDKNPDFSFDATPIDQYLLKEKRGANNQLASDKAFVGELKAIQRISKLIPRYKAAETLIKDNIHSAQQIYAMGRNQFMKRFQASPGFTPALADEAFKKAADTHAAVMIMVGELRSMETSSSLYALNGAQAQAVNLFPDWSALFGSTDVCDCEHCRSVYSPSAYMADLLQFLKNRLLPVGTSSARDVLFRRRPDIGFIELNCPNANTPIVYTDGACEVMEEEISPSIVFNNVIPGGTWTNNATIANTINNIFNTNSIALPAGFIVSDIRTVTDRSTYDCRVIRTESATYKAVINAAGTAIDVYLLRQTHGKADELSASPEYVNENAYNLLSAATYPSNLPLDLFTEETRMFLEKVEVKKWELMQAFKGNNLPNNPTDLAIASEYLGVSQAERPYIFTQDIVTQQKFWNYSTSAAMLTGIKNVRTFLDRTNLTFLQLQKLLDLSYINPGGLLHIQNLDNSCDLNKKEIQVLDISAMDRIQRFLRLWKKLGWEMWELDYAIMHPQLGQTDIGNNLLLQLMYCGLLREKFTDLTVEQIGALLGDISRINKYTAPFEKREPSFYDNLFLNKKLINPIDTAFELTGPLTPVKDHAGVVIGASRIREQELYLLLELKKTNGTDYLLNNINAALNLQHLSFIYRHSLFARFNEIKVKEWAGLLALYNTDVVAFASAKEIFEWVEKVNLYKDSYSYDELIYLLAHDDTSRVFPQKKKMDAFIIALRSGVKKIHDSYRMPDTAEETKIFLGAALQKVGIHEEAVSNAIKILSNENLQTKKLLAALPNNFSGFAPAVTNTVSISYEAGKLTLSFTGVMTDAQKATLLTDASIDPAVLADPAYIQAVNDLYNAPRNLIVREISFFEKPVFRDPLTTANAPTDADFKKLTSVLLKNDCWFDAEAQQLVYRGVMTVTERNALQAISPNAFYQASVQNLFVASAAYAAPVANQWVKAADINTMFNLPLVINTEQANLNGQNILAILYRFLEPKDQESFIVQQVEQEFQLDADIAKFLISQHNFFPAPVFTLLNYFKNSPPPYTEDEKVYHWLYKVGFIANKEKMDIAAFTWHRDFFVLTGMLDWQTLPTVAVAPTASIGGLMTLHQFMEFNRRWTDPGISVFSILKKLHAGEYAASSDLAKDLALLTGWAEEDVIELAKMPPPLNNQALDINYPADWKQIKNLLRIDKAMKMIVAINARASFVRELARPAISKAVSSKLKQSLRSKYDEQSWLDISKGIQDRLRERKRDALSGYLLAHKPIHVPAATKWETTNDLYGYYLIDVEMCACQFTSRIVQANGSIQLFTQRCLMGLEPDVKVDKDEDDNWLHWKWMKNYRVWEANRKIFLYPENWIEPELRRDKSIFFRDFENELMQNEVNKDNVESAFLNYLEKLDGVAQLEIAGFNFEESKNILHVFGRTPVGEPHMYFYRKLVDNRRWTAWSKVEVDIKSDYLIPAVINERLYIFWPEFNEEPKPVGPQSVPTSGGGGTREEADKLLRVKMGVSEWRNNKWLAKKLSKDSILSTSYKGELLKDKYKFIPADLVNIGKGFYIKCEGHGNVKNEFGNFVTTAASINGVFEVFGCKGVPELSMTSLGGFLDYQKVVDTELEYMRAKELRDRSSGDFFTFEAVQASAINNYKSAIAKATHILEKTPLTPGIFKVTTSPNMSELDKLYEESFLSFLKDKRSVNGVWADFFFADKTRTFFVQTVLNDGSKLWYYKDVKDWIDSFRRIIEQWLEDWLATTAGITEPQKTFWRDLIRYWFNTIALAILGGLIPLRQYYFKNFYHPFVCLFAKEVLNRGIDGLMRREIQLKQGKFEFKTTYEPTPKVLDEIPAGETTSPYYPVEEVDFNAGGSYSQYNWELFFHAPLLIAGNLSRNQRFEEAMDWYHYIFNPLSVELKDEKGIVIPLAEPQRKFWITKPFFNNLSADYNKQRIENIMKMLAGDTTIPGYTNTYFEELKGQVEDWRDNPFEPHKIAEFRTVAYQKTVVMKYIDNLIAWGDQLFRRDTMESINEATQLYVRAAEILGARPRKVSPNSKPAVETYNELAPKLDVFSNALINVENFVPPMPGGGGGSAIPLPTVLYFCIPQNDKLLGYWDIVADRLYKVRHCLNIEGVFRQLALFEPPIDPAQLVRAIAGGADLSSALSDLNAPTPHYRFPVMLQKANELCNDVKALGAALLSALEKKDGEAMSLLRQTHEIRNLELMKEIKEKQLADSETMVEGLRKNKEMVTIRRDYYQSRQFMNSGEIAAMTLSGTTIALQAVAMSMDILGGVLTIIPDFTLGASGFGGSPMAVAKIGGMSIGKALELASKGISQTVGIIDKSAGLVSTVAGYQRRQEDWTLQKDLASKELEQVDKSIYSAELKVAISTKELKNHETQIENSKAVDEFMRTKYTNKELYDWMTGQISQTYFQTYQLAYDLAKRAEKCYQYELGVQNSSIIQFGYWDSLKKGLMSGEKLQFDLRKLEATYMEQNKREMELTKQISLALLNPAAVIQLRETGRCAISLPEAIFDLDYPGHYFRRIKSVAISLPCIAGPNTTVNCTLRLLSNSIRINQNLSNNKYERNNDGGVPVDDQRFRENSINIKSIATSGAQNDNGVFELNFRDDRYLPFEGAGVISNWSIELLSHPDEDTKMLRQFDYSTISDVIIHLKFTAREDAGLFKKKAIEYLKNLIKDAAANTTMPLMQMINVKHEFADEFNQLRMTPAAQANGAVKLKIDKERFAYLAGRLKLKIKSMIVAAVFSDNAAGSAQLMDPDGNPALDGNPNLPMTDTPRFGNRIKYGIKQFDYEVKNSDVPGAVWDWTLSMPRARAIKLQDLFIVMEYELKP